MNKSYYFFVFLIFSVLVAGCVSFSYDIPNKIEMEEGKGVILLSTGAAKKSASSARNLLIKKSDSGKVVASLHIDNFALKSHFDDHVGFVHSVNLEEGEYEVSLAVLNTYLKAKNRQSSPKFTVKSGEVIYLGEIFLTDNEQLYQVSNKFNRDFEKITSKGATINRDKIKISIINL